MHWNQDSSAVDPQTSAERENIGQTNIGQKKTVSSQGQGSILVGQFFSKGRI